MSAKRVQVNGLSGGVSFEVEKLDPRDGRVRLRVYNDNGRWVEIDLRYAPMLDNGLHSLGRALLNADLVLRGAREGE